LKELLAVWRDTRMVVIVAVVAALYAAVLVPMKVIMPLVPGFTEVRPANVLPILFSFLFGPAAAWGSAFGNVVADFFGTFGPGSIFGFVGNFLFGLVPYKLWRFWGGRVLGWQEERALMPVFRSHEAEGGGRRLLWSSAALYALVSVVAAASCAFTIAWGVDLLGFVDFKVLGNIIFLNNTAMALILGPPLIAALGRRVRAWDIAYTGGAPPSFARGVAGTALLVVGAIGGLVVGNVLTLSGAAGAGVLAAAPFSLVLVPFLLCVLAGALIL